MLVCAFPIFGLPVGHFATRKGPVTAAADTFEVVVHGRGGHAARPNTTIDPVIIAAQIITGLQLIAARETDPLESVVVTVATMHAGTARNIIPESAILTGTVRTFSAPVRADPAGCACRRLPGWRISPSRRP